MHPTIEKPQSTPRPMTASESLVTVQFGTAIAPAAPAAEDVVAVGGGVVDVVQSSSSYSLPDLKTRWLCPVGDAVRDRIGIEVDEISLYFAVSEVGCVTKRIVLAPSYISFLLAIILLRGGSVFIQGNQKVLSETATEVQSSICWQVSV